MANGSGDTEKHRNGYQGSDRDSGHGYFWPKGHGLIQLNLREMES